MLPIVIFSSVKHQCAASLWPDDFGCFVGYRFLEGQPKIILYTLLHPPTRTVLPPPAPPEQYNRNDAWLDNWQTTYSDSRDPLYLRFQTLADG